MTSSQLMQICAWFKWSGLWKWYEKLVTLHVTRRYRLLCYYLKSLYFNNQYQVIVVQWEEGSSAHLKKGLYESPLLLMKALLSCCKRSLIIRTCNALTWKRDKIIKVSRTLFGWTFKKNFYNRNRGTSHHLTDLCSVIVAWFAKHFLPACKELNILRGLHWFTNCCFCCLLDHDRVSVPQW